MFSSHLFQLSCHSSFVPRCPFLLNLDLIGIANRFAQFNLPAFALGTLHLIPCANKKAQQIQVSTSMSMQHARMNRLEDLCDLGPHYSHIAMTIAVFLPFPGLPVFL